MRYIQWRYFQWLWVTPNYTKPPRFRYFLSPFVQLESTMDGKPPWMGMVRSREPFTFWGTPTISPERLKLGWSNFACCRPSNPSLRWQTATNVRDQSRMTRFCLNFAPVISFLSVNLGISNQILCTDWYRGVRVHAWYITPKRDGFRVTWPL